MKKRLLFLVVFSILAGALVWKFARHAAAPTVPKHVTAITGAQKVSGGYRYVKDSDFYTIEVEYPASTKLSGDGENRALTVMEDWVIERMRQFESNAGEMLDAQEKARLTEQGRKYALGISYKRYDSDGRISYVYQIYEDTGGAHPNTYYMTFAFDHAGIKLGLGDLFKPDSRYLDRLSKISYDYLVVDLAKRFESELDEGQLDWIRMGTAPSPETLQFFYLDGDALVLMFPPYQVAAYVAGKSEVRIPLETIADILK